MNTKQNIPVFNLTRQFQKLQRDIFSCAREILASGDYILSKNVSCFEREFSRYCGVKYAISVASGTDALKIALAASGIDQGDQVIVPPFTFVATSDSVHHVGGRVVFADIKLDSYNIDPR
ncbi:DegT/DnrJ/EryC1/StrS family aminotransferase, partial [Candidatus Omnitrophota bacterium]